MSHRLFVVEDDADLREVYGRFFGKAGGLEVCGTAETAAEAVALIPAAAPDLVLVDLTLPDTQGFELVDTLRRQHPDLRLLVVTGYVDADLEAGAGTAGADGIIGKGDPAKLLETVRKLLRA